MGQSNTLVVCGVRFRCTASREDPFLPSPSGRGDGGEGVTLIKFRDLGFDPKHLCVRFGAFTAKRNNFLSL